MSEYSRKDGRAWDQLRPITIIPGYQKYAEGSALIEMGTTKVLCAASLEEKVPAFMRGQGKGWVTAEYSMLPRATNTRNSRERETGKVSGRSQEIQRLIGRSLRAVTNLDTLGERTVHIDCDVIQADGGTRTAAITGAYVALNQALQMLVKNRELTQVPLLCPVAAISVGILNGELLLDLCYEEDFAADVDFNVVLTSQGGLVELQGATEADPFPRHQVDEVLSLASRGMESLFRVQREAAQGF
ncbi:MAG TPA: ribonuclease PH [Dehalococcoidia bacterium]|nr:ribonuclease PH [Dehalococcoidia bacterium]HIL31409.1 ribonuclease PH [Dehalococcoidia bacterium]